MCPLDALGAQELSPVLKGSILPSGRAQSFRPWLLAAKRLPLWTSASALAPTPGRGRDRLGAGRLSGGSSDEKLGHGAI